MHEGRMQTGYQMAHAGSRLKPTDCLERHRLESQPSSRTGENPPYGMIGRIEETSASYEVRSAPRSYPTTFESDPGRRAAARLMINDEARRVAAGIAKVLELLW